MLTLQDCIAMCGLTAEEIEAIAEHEHVPEMVAAEIADYLVRSPEGMPILRRVIVDDLAAARAQGDHARIRRLHAVLRRFVADHPGCRCASEEELASMLPRLGGRMSA
jgi:hypothetical protein